MTWMIPRRWRALALAAPSLTALLLPVVTQAKEPEQPTEERKRESRDDQEVSGGRAGLFPPVTRQGISQISAGSGMPVRHVNPAPERMHQLSGQVVKLNGQVLYVETQVGAVVPLDLSALETHKAPEKGQTVVATYQVENTTENVALSLAGEVPR